VIEVHIDDRFERNGIDIHVFERLGPGRVRIYKPEGIGFASYEEEEWHEGSVMPTYPFHIPREAAGPLWAALGKLLGSVENPEMLRKDFVHEQARRDTLENAIIDLAKAGVR
jgi:hypothetical protein